MYVSQKQDHTNEVTLYSDIQLSEGSYWPHTC